MTTTTTTLPIAHARGQLPFFFFFLMSTQRANVERELFSACEAGDVDRVHRVIAAGADPRKAIKRDILAGHGETPLHTACQYVYTSSNKLQDEILSLL